MTDLVKVYLLWHVHHQSVEGVKVCHFVGPDDFWADEENGDDVKLLGTYSSGEAARDGRGRARKLSGFRNEPECFHVEEFVVDEDQWTEGYVSD
ncbi:hypothetical protein ACF1FX_02530 [Streptomyces sp. NPDC014646]|uniref:hypothetical protein n=1 Tax=unclassified Streptomyces TaxID=2593676 RepID=UPI003701394F